MNHPPIHDPETHLPFIATPLVAPSSWLVLDRARKHFIQRKLWSEDNELQFEGLRLELRRLDELANAARMSLLGIHSATLALQCALAQHAPGRDGAADQHEDTALICRDHGASTKVSRDIPFRHAFHAGPAADIVLAAARLGGADGALRASLAQAAGALCMRPVARIADMLAALFSAPDLTVAAPAVVAALRCSGMAGGLAMQVFPIAEQGGRRLDWPAWHGAVAALLDAIAQGSDPVSAAVTETSRPDLDGGIDALEPRDVTEPALDGPPVTVALTGRFPEQRPAGVDASTGGQRLQILGWSPGRVQLGIPRGAPSGQVHFSQELGASCAAALREAGLRLAAIPGLLQGSLFERMDWTRLAPIPSGRCKGACTLQVRHWPRVRRFDVTDEDGHAIASLEDLRMRTRDAPADVVPLAARAGSKVRIAWDILPLDFPDAQPIGQWAPNRHIPLHGELELTLPDHRINLGLNIPGTGPLDLNVDPSTFLTLVGPGEICLVPGTETLLEFVLGGLNQPPLRVEVDVTSSRGRVNLTRTPVPIRQNQFLSTIVGLTATPRPGAPIPAGICAGHEGETGIIPLWPDDPPEDRFDITVRVQRLDGVTMERIVRVNIQMPGGRWVRGGCVDVLGIHVALLPDGRLLYFGYDAANRNRLGHGHAQTWSRAEGPGPLTTLDYNPFCSGHALRADGSLAVAGGHAADQGGDDTTVWGIIGFFFIGAGGFFAPQGLGNGDSKKVRIVRADPGSPGAAPQWNALSEMNGARWYPTCVTLANGDVMVIGGSAPFLANAWHRTNDDHERIDRTGVLRRPFDDLPEGADYHHSGGRQLPSSGEGRVETLYNLAHLLPSMDASHEGYVFLVADALARVYDPQANILVGDPIDLGGVFTWWTQTSSVLLPIDVDADGNASPTVEILVPGGGTTGLGGDDGADDPAIGTMTIVEYNIRERSLSIVSRGTLTRPRVLGDSILLPDGTVLLVNGASTGFANSNRDRVTRPDLIKLTPQGPVAVPMANGVIERGYHSTAILLPDASVAVAGSTGGYSGTGDMNTEDFRVQVFEPPYLSCGTRPQILSAPGAIRYGERFRVEVDDLLARPYVVLIRCSSSTHSLNTDQRMLQLWIDEPLSGRPRAWLEVRMVRNRTFAPPGYYLMFVLTLAGVPSIGRYCRVDG